MENVVPTPKEQLVLDATGYFIRDEQKYFGLGNPNKDIIKTYATDAEIALYAVLADLLEQREDLALDNAVEKERWS